MADYHVLKNACTKSPCIMEGIILECSFESSVFRNDSYLKASDSYIGGEYINRKSFYTFCCKLIDVFTGVPIDISFGELTKYRNSGFISDWGFSSALSNISPRQYVRFEYTDTKNGYDLSKVKNFGALSKNECHRKGSQRQLEDFEVFQRSGVSSLSYHHLLHIEYFTQTKGSAIYQTGCFLESRYNYEDNEVSFIFEAESKKVCLTFHNRNYETVSGLSMGIGSCYNELYNLRRGEYFRLIYIKNADAKSCVITPDETDLFDGSAIYKHPKFNNLFWFETCLGKDIMDEMKLNQKDVANPLVLSWSEPLNKFILE